MITVTLQQVVRYHYLSSMPAAVPLVVSLASMGVLGVFLKLLSTAATLTDTQKDSQMMEISGSTTRLRSTTNSLPAPRKVVFYSIAGDPKAGALYLYGNPDSSSIAMFCSGFPDDHKNGQAFCSNLAEKNKTLVGLMCLPGFDDRLDKPWWAHKKGGYTFDEMATAVRDAVKVLRMESTVDEAKLTGIFHDWGVGIGLLWANKSMDDNNVDSPDELVLLDILPPVHRDNKNDIPDFEKPTTYKVFLTWLYRIILATSFALQLYVSKYIALVFYTIGYKPLFALGLSPVFQTDVDVRDSTIDLHRKIYMAYPYFQTLKSMMSTEGKELLSMISLTKNLKKTPILYLYGTEKPVMFHDNGALRYLQREAKERRSKSNAIAVESAGHWLHLQQPHKCLDEVMKFMAK